MVLLALLEYARATPALLAPETQNTPLPPSMVCVVRDLGAPHWVLPVRLEGERVFVGTVGSEVGLALDSGARVEVVPERQGPEAGPYVPLPWAPGLEAYRVEVEHPVIDAIVSLPDGTVAALDEDVPARGTWTVRGQLRIRDEMRRLPPVGAGLVLHIGGKTVKTDKDGRFEIVLPAGVPAPVSLPDGPQSGIGCSLQRSLLYGGDQQLELVWFCAAPC